MDDEIKLNDKTSSKKFNKELLIGLLFGVAIGVGIGFFITINKRGPQPAAEKPKQTSQVDSADETYNYKDKAFWESKLIETKTYKEYETFQFQLGAYRLAEDKSGFLYNSFLIAPIDNGIPQGFGNYIMTTIYGAWGYENKFVIYNNQIYVINQETNTIGVYKYQPTTPKTTLTLENCFLVHVKTIQPPKLAIGTFYEITCSDADCSVKSAHHLESGCTMNLNLSTEVYSNVTCHNHSGEFEPTKLE